MFAAIGVHFQHEGTLDDKNEAFFQCAILYTTMFGLRRIRVINVSLPTSQIIGNYFKFADIDVVMNFMAKTGKLFLFFSFLLSVLNLW